LYELVMPFCVGLLKDEHCGRSSCCGWGTVLADGGSPVDPVSLITEALAAGLSATVTGAVQDAYAGLRALLVRKFRGDGDDESAELQVRELEARAAGELEPAVAAAGLASDEQVLAAAAQVLSAADPAGARVGKYVIDLRDAKGVQVGDNPTMTINF
jgi:hypothetical protein